MTGSWIVLDLNAASDIPDEKGQVSSGSSSGWLTAGNAQDSVKDR